MNHYNNTVLTTSRKQLPSEMLSPLSGKDVAGPSQASLLPCRIQRTYQCTLCDLVTRNPRDFLYHQRDVHGEKLKVYECSQCVYASRHQQKLQRHIGFVHAVARQRKPRTPSAFRQPVAKKSMKRPQSKSPLMLSPTGMAPSFTQNFLEPPNKMYKVNQIQYPNHPINVEGMSNPEEEIVEIIEGEEDEFLNITTPEVTMNSFSNQQVSNELEFKCSVCPFKSKSKILVQRHEKVSHLRKKFFRCSQCNYVTNMKGRFNRHLRYHSFPCLQCTYCDFKTTHKWSLRRHLKGHTSSTIYACTLCTYVTHTKQSLTAHIIRHHKDLKGEECYATALELASQNLDVEQMSADPDNLMNGESSEFIQHSLSVNKYKPYSKSHYPHGNSSAEFYIKCGKWYRRKLKCQFCAFRTSSSSELYEHEEHHYKENGTPSCPLCRETFMDVTTAKQHVQAKHGNAIQLTEQQGTAKIRSSPDLVSPGTSDKPLKCRTCPYEAKWMSEMIKHNRIHTREKPFECRYCGFRSRWKGDMTRHVQKYHSSAYRKRNSMKPFSEEDHFTMVDDGASVDDAYHNLDSESPTSIAIEDESYNENLDNNFESNEKLNAEDQKESGMVVEKPIVVNDKLMVVDIEQYAHEVPNEDDAVAGNSKNRNSMRPLRKRYQCPHCAFSASTASRFHVHIVAHLNRRPFMCSECGYRSNWQWDVTKHIRLKAGRGENHLHATLVMLNEVGERNYEKYNESTSKKGMYSHLPKHTDDPFFCGECGQSSKWRHVIERHCRLLHGNVINIIENKSAVNRDESNNNAENNVTPFEDVNANSGFIRDPVNNLSAATPYIVKRRMKPNYKQYFCKICPYKCRKITDFQTHMRLHQPQPDAIFKCMFCPFFTSLRRALLQHMKLHVREPHEYISQAMENSQEKVVKPPEEAETKFQAPASVSIVEESPAFNNDNNNNNSINDDNNIISITSVNSDGSGTSNNNNNSIAVKEKVEEFNEAKETTVGEGEAMMFVSVQMKRYSCEYCPYTSNSKTQYLYHKQFHRNPKACSFKCPHCNYSVTKGHLLMQHIKLHNRAATTGGNESISITNSQSTGEPKPMETIADGQGSGMLRCGVEALTIHSSLPNQKKLGIPLVWVSKGSTMLKMYKCRFCPHVNKRRSNIREHEKMHRKRKLMGKYACPNCTYVCNNQGVLSAHLKVHQNTKNVASSIDYNLENSSSNLQDDSMSALIPETYMPTEIKNDDAEVTIDVEPTLTRPVTQQATTLHKPFHFCEICPARFTRACDVIVHQKFHGANLAWKCKQCNYAARHRPHLHRHMKVHTAEYQRKTKELHNLQNSATSLPLTTIREIQRLSYDYEKRHHCHLCPATFLKPSNLAHHLSLHGGKGKFKCHYCNYAVKNIGNLVRHMKIHDPSRSKANLRMDGNLGETNLDSYAVSGFIPRKEQKRLYCPKCPAVFEKNSRFEIHMRLHGSQQKFTCHYCDYSVKFMANLMKHQKIHLTEPVVPMENSHMNVEYQMTDELHNGSLLEKAPVIKSSTSGYILRKDINELSLSEQQMLMLQHQQQMAQQQQYGEDAKRFFFCDRCPYQHPRKDAVQSHLKRHTSHQEMVCAYCDYSTTLPSFLRIHTKLHFQHRKNPRVETYMQWDQIDVWAMLPGGEKKIIFNDKGETIKENRFSLVNGQNDSGENGTEDNEKVAPSFDEEIKDSDNLTAENNVPNDSESLPLAEDKIKEEENLIDDTCVEEPHNLNDKEDLKGEDNLKESEEILNSSESNVNGPLLNGITAESDDKKDVLEDSGITIASTEQKEETGPSQALLDDSTGIFINGSEEKDPSSPNVEDAKSEAMDVDIPDLTKPVVDEKSCKEENSLPDAKEVETTDCKTESSPTENCVNTPTTQTSDDEANKVENNNVTCTPNSDIDVKTNVVAADDQKETESEDMCCSFIKDTNNDSETEIILEEHSEFTDEIAEEIVVQTSDTPLELDEEDCCEIVAHLTGENQLHLEINDGVDNVGII